MTAVTTATPLPLAPDLRARFIRWAWGLFRHRPDPHDPIDLTRPIYVAEYQGHYGFAGYVLTVEGSPTKATILVDFSNQAMIAIYCDVVIVGSHRSYKSKAQRTRYNQAVEWVWRLGLRPAGPRGAYEDPPKPAPQPWLSTMETT